MTRSLPSRFFARRRLAMLLFTAVATTLAAAALALAQSGPVAWATPTAGRTDIWAGHRVIVRFNQPMNRASVEAGLTLAPPAPGTFAWADDYQVEYVPSEPYPPGQAYAATVATTVRDLGGRAVLTEPYRWSFAISTTPEAPAFSGGLPVQLLTPSGGRGMPIQPNYPRGTFAFTLYALDAPAFVQRYAALRPNLPSAIPVDGLRVAAAWSKWLDASENPVDVALPAGTPPGLYVLDARHPNTRAGQTLLMYSDYALTTQIGRRGLSLWAAQVPSGAPGAGPRVTLYDASGRSLGTVTGDGEGVARFAERQGARMAVAEVAGQATAVGLDGYWYSQGYYSPWWTGGMTAGAGIPAPVAYAAHIHTDRPIYRPGHTVHYKATLRALGGDEPAVLAASTPVSVTIRDAGNNVIQRTALRTDGFGGVHGDLRLGDEVALGDWRIEVLVGGRALQGRFKVEEYVKPDYEVQVLPDKPYYIRGETTRVKVQAGYYFGQPVSGGDVVLRVFRNGYYNRNDPLVERRGTLDASGGWTTDVNLQPQGESSETFTIEAEVVDASRRPVYAAAAAPVHPAAFSLGLVNHRYGVEAGQPVELDVSTIGHDGRPAAGRRVELEAQGWDYRGGYRVVKRETVTTGADGTVTARLTGLDYGWYEIRASARDDAGRMLAAGTYAWLYSSRYPWYWGGELEVKADRESYAEGDTARLLIRSPITGTALVILERDEVYDEIVVPVRGATPVEVPIKAAYAPNVHAKVVVWQPMDDRFDWALNGAAGRLLVASADLVVPAVDRRLRVDVVPDAPVHAPGEEARYTLKVRDAEGNPVNAQLALAVVDKAVLALADDTSGDIFDAYWRSREDAVGTHDGLRPSHWYAYEEYDQSERRWWSGGVPGAPTPSPAATGTPTAAGPRAPGMADEPGETVQTAPRKEFKDTAYWNPAIETGPDGEVTVTVLLPDNLTTWSALARAITVDTRAGQGSGELIVTKPIIADPALPRFLVQGDQFALDVLGRNYAGGTQVGTCALDAPGLVVLDKGDRAMSLPFNETRVARWSAVASSVGINTVKARLVTPAGSDAIELPLEVQPFGVPERFARSGSTTSVAVETIEMPFKAVPEDALVEIRLTPSIATGVFDGAADLVGYPYGCVEQTMSKMLPNAVVARLAHEVGIEAPEALAKLPEYMEIGRQKLYGFQNGDGSWGWWPGTQGRNLYLTAYVLHGLTLSKQAGFEIDASVLDRGFGWLAGAVPGEQDPNMRAYALYIMAEAGRAGLVAGAADDLYAKRASLDAFGLGALAVTLGELDRREAALATVDDLVRKVVETPSTAHWSMGAPPGGHWHAYYWQSIASDEKSTAMALVALSRLQPGHRLAPKAVGWLLEHRSGAGWSTTHGTAFAIIGLTDHVIASGELRPDYDWSVQLDGATVAEGRVDGRTKPGDIPPIVLTGGDLGPGTHHVAIGVRGEGTLYYTVSGRMTLFYPQFEPTRAAGIGVTLTREYVPVEGRGGAGGWRAGDLINVRLTMTTDRDVHYMLIEDRLPAGFEALNEGLKTETTRTPGQAPPWRWWGYERKEVRDDKVTFFDTHLTPGTHTFEYAARAVTPGTFSARPAEAYAMYRPDVWGRSASDQVQIDAARVAQRPALAGDFDRDCRLTGFDAALVADVWGQAVGAATRERDVNGDGRLDVADIATAGGRAGLECGDIAPLPPGRAGDVRLSLQVPPVIAVGQAFDVEIVADANGGAGIDVGAWEATLALPAGAFEVVDLSGGVALAEMRRLGPLAEGGAGAGTLRVGGFVPAAATVRGKAVLAKLTLRALREGDLGIRVTRAQVVDGRGGEHVVTADGTVVSPAPWRPVKVLHLPKLER